MLLDLLGGVLVAVSKQFDYWLELCRAVNFLLVELLTLFILNDVGVIGLESEYSQYLLLKINDSKQRLRHFGSSHMRCLLPLLAYSESAGGFLLNRVALARFSDLQLLLIFLLLEPHALGLEIFADHFAGLVVAPGPLYFFGCGGLGHGGEFERLWGWAVVRASCGNLCEIYYVLLCNYFI